MQVCVLSSLLLIEHLEHKEAAALSPNWSSERGKKPSRFTKGAHREEISKAGWPFCLSISSFVNGVESLTLFTRDAVYKPAGW